MFSKRKYVLTLFFILIILLYLILNCTTKYIERPLIVGSIFVQSEPDSANIFLDNQSTGKLTPDTLFDVPTGMNQISVSKAGYISSPTSITVEVLENQTASASFNLFDVNYGFLYVSSTPESARIIIDNNLTGQYTPHLFANDVPVDTHIVSVSKDGYSTDLPSKYVVDIPEVDTAIDTVQLDFSLTPATQGKEAGKLAWDFDLLDDFNNRIILSNYRGYIVVLQLWAQGCPFCMQELPYLQDIYEEYQVDTVKVFAINYEDNLSTISFWRDSLNVTFTLLVGAGNNVVHNNYYPGGTPVTLILDRTGIVYYYQLGFLPRYANEFRTKLNELLGK